MHVRREVATIERRFVGRLAQHRIRRRRWQRVRRDAELLSTKRDQARAITLH